MAARAPICEYGRIALEIGDERRAETRSLYARHRGVRRLRLALIVTPAVAVAAFAATVNVD